MVGIILANSFSSADLDPDKITQCLLPVSTSIVRVAYNNLNHTPPVVAELVWIATFQSLFASTLISHPGKKVTVFQEV